MSLWTLDVASWWLEASVSLAPAARFLLLRGDLSFEITCP